MRIQNRTLRGRSVVGRVGLVGGEVVDGFQEGPDRRQNVETLPDEETRKTATRARLRPRPRPMPMPVGSSSLVRGPFSAGPYRVLLEDEALFRREKSYGDLVKDVKAGVSFAEVTPENQHACIRKVMEPFSHMPYEEELELKRQKNEEFVLLHQEVSRQEESTVCHPVAPSPLRAGYRRKDEFSVNVGVDGDERTVGFYVGSPRRGLVCVPADDISIISGAHKRVAAAYRDFLHASPLRPNLTMGNVLDNDGGHWRTLFVRSNRAGEVMATVTFHPQRMSEDQIREQKESIAAFLSPAGEGRGAGVTSLYFQASAVPTGHSAPCELLFGPPALEETVRGRKFMVGPESFFHTNVEGLDTLVEVVKERTFLGPGVTLLDLCCGVGLYGVLFGHLVDHVVGIDVSAAAVQEAQRNAEANHLKNAEYMCGKLEHCLGEVLEELEAGPTKLSVIVNPGRSGINFRAIEMLRMCPKVRRIVYVSCQPEGSAFTNFKDLSKVYRKGFMAKRRHYKHRFRLEEAIPVDMFPGTHCCEHVLVFNRQK